MLITLLGYMGSGKTTVAKSLSQELDLENIDLDQEIISETQMEIPEMFQKKGELFFRNKEREILTRILNTKKHAVISLGGGTPAYFDNMDLVNQFSTSFFLRASVKTLSERLIAEKNERPLISKIKDEELHEFIAKHLFERNPYYNRAKTIIGTDGKSVEQIAEEIISKI